MPAITKTTCIYMPNKAGANNAVITALERTGQGKQVNPKNGMFYDAGDRKKIMIVCDPYARATSMFNYMTAGRMSQTSKYVGMSFEDWLSEWIADHRLGKKPKVNSWFMTLTQCWEYCNADYIIRSENMGECMAAIGCNIDDAGSWKDAYRHRTNHSVLFETNSSATKLFTPIIQSDLDLFGYCSRVNNTLAIESSQ